MHEIPSMSLQRPLLVIFLLASMVWSPGASWAEGRSNSALRWLNKGRSLRSLGVTQHRTKGLISRNEALTRARAKEQGLVWVAPHTRTLKSGKVVNVKGHFRGRAVSPKKQLSSEVVSDKALLSFHTKIRGQHTLLLDLFANLRWQALRQEGLEARVARAAKSKNPEERALQRLLQPELRRTRRLASRLRALLPALLAHPTVQDQSTVIWQQQADGGFYTDFADMLKNPKMSRQEYSAYRRLLPQLEARGKKDFLQSARNRASLDAETEVDVKLARFKVYKASGKLPADAVPAAYTWVKGKRGRPGHFRRSANWQAPEPVNLPALVQRLEAASQGSFAENLPFLLRRAASAEYADAFHRKALRSELAQRDGGRAAQVFIAMTSASKNYKWWAAKLASHAKLQGGIDISFADVHAMRLRLEANPRTKARMEAAAKAALADRLKSIP